MIRTKNLRAKVGEIKYKPEYSKMAYEVSLLGATDRDLARIFDVSPGTIQNWKKYYPEFVENLERGKDRADAKIAKALYQRCIGYSHADTHITGYKGEVTITPIRKYYAPDTAAIKFWLTNRQKEMWAETHKVEQNTNVHLHGATNLDDVPLDELKLMMKVGMREQLRKQAKQN